MIVEKFIFLRFERNVSKFNKNKTGYNFFLFCKICQNALKLELKKLNPIIYCKSLQILESSFKFFKLIFQNFKLFRNPKT